MHPAFSVIFLTVLIGVGQGLFLAVAGIAIATAFGVAAMAPEPGFAITASAIATGALLAGLFASFGHLGRPERAFQAIRQWRTSWLSREVILLPVFIGAVALYGLIAWTGRDPLIAGIPLSLLVAIAGIVLAVAVFVATGMVYACIRFLAEWNSPLTVINYLLLGSASGFVTAVAIAAFSAPRLVAVLAATAVVLTLAGLFTRSLSLARNARLRPKSTPQSAIGIDNAKIAQRSQGAMGGSFNTREFFHGRSATFLKSLRWIFLAAAFVLPVLLLLAGLASGNVAWFLAAVAVQIPGLMVERWVFFAEANHPQNIYYQSIA